MTDGRISVAVVSHVVTDEVAAMFARLKREAPVDNGTNPSPNPLPQGEGEYPSRDDLASFMQGGSPAAGRWPTRNDSTLTMPVAVAAL
jgi:hypothetical protein